MKFLVKYLFIIFLGCFYSSTIFGQSAYSMKEFIQSTKWIAPHFDSQVYADSITLYAINKAGNGVVIQSLEFLKDGKIETLFAKEVDCGMGLLRIYTDSSFYSVKGNKLTMELKGEYIGEKVFSFKKDYLIKRINKSEIQLLCIKIYYDETIRN